MKMIEEHKAREQEVSIHLQNAQLYVFGVIFGAISLQMSSSRVPELCNAFEGFNAYAYATVGILAVVALGVIHSEIPR